MIAGLDSSFSRPTSSIAAQARAAGVRLWSGYLATKGGVNLASPWDLASFDIARQVGGTPIAFCSGWDDPVACRNQAAQWNVRLCLDVEAGIRPDGSWVQQWLDLSDAGLYGQHYQDTSGVWHSIHLDRKAAFHVMSWYIGRDPGANWTGPQPADGTPLGWQWQGGHTEFGLDVDRGWYDDWFGGAFGASTFTKEGHPMAALIQDTRNATWLVADACYGPKRPVNSSAELQAYQATLTALGLPSAPRTDIPQFVVDAMTAEKGYETFDPNAVTAALAAIQTSLANLATGGGLSAAQQAELDAIAAAQVALGKHLGLGTP